MELSFEVKKPLEVVLHALTDPSAFVRVHPVITKMDALDNNRFRVHETVNLLGFIRYSFCYYATVTQHRPENVVKISASVMKVTKIDMCFRLSEKYGATQVDETITWRSPLPVGLVLKRLFAETHAELFRNIERQA